MHHGITPASIMKIALSYATISWSSKQFSVFFWCPFELFINSSLSDEFALRKTWWKCGMTMIFEPAFSCQSQPVLRGKICLHAEIEPSDLKKLEPCLVVFCTIFSPERIP